SMLPADLTRCRLQFDGDAELSYEVTMATFEFVDFLFDVVASMRLKKSPDFSKMFYRRLLRMDE
ncbi:MAG: type IV pilus biogenesis protein EbsA, partial [Cyanobacteria bacterium P01_D01_bin.44]